MLHPLLDKEPGIVKLCQFPAVDEHGNRLLEVFHHPDQLHHSYMDKVAAPFLPQVREYIDNLKPDPNSIYALVNALGAFEFWSSNINGDGFEEEMLIHRGPVWGYETFVHYARPFMHHCFRAGTEVVMGDRTRKPIALVGEGDLVETRGGPRIVKRTMKRRYSGPGVRLSMSGVTEDLEASWDHPVFVYRRDTVHCSHKYSRLRPEQRHFREYHWCLGDIGDPEEVTIGSVLPGDYMVFPKPRLGGEAVRDEFASLVGWVASEGYCAGERGMIQFTFCEFNYEDIASVTKCLENNGLHVTRTDLPDKEQVVLSSWSVDFWDRLQDYVVGVKSEKHLTGKVLSWNERALKTLLGAYIDGDGHVPEKGQNEGQLRIRSSSSQMLAILSDVIRALGVPTTVQWDDEPGYRTFPHGSTYWCAGSGTVTVTPQFSPEVTKRSRKYHVREMKKTYSRMLVGDLFLVRVTGREDTHLEEDIYNLEVESDPEYVAGGVLVHNCNKGPNARAFGSVELSCWHDRMKRVELVVRLDRSDAEEVGAHKVIDKIDHGQLPDTSMGCAPAGTRILTPQGYSKAVELLRVGDGVLTHRGVSRKVTQTMRRRYCGILYTFKTYGIRETLPLTDEHPLLVVGGEQLGCDPLPAGHNRGRKQRHCTPLVKDRSKGCSGCQTEPKYQFEWKRADETQVGDYLAFPIPQGTDQTITSEEEARFLGLYLAEGHVCNYNDRPLEQIVFSLGLDEKKLADEIESLGRSLGAAVTWQDEIPTQGGRRANVVHKDLARRCLQYCGSGANTKELSREVLHMDNELQKVFLGAYLDGDGGVYRGSAYFSTSSKHLAEQIFLILSRCGVIASVNQIDHHPSKRSVVRRDTVEYQVWVGTDFSPILAPHTNKDGIRDSIKVHGVRFLYEHEGVTYILAPIMEIEESAYDGDVFNVSVEDHDSYVAEGVAVHNCKVPYDLCSITTNWDLYRKALAGYDPHRDRHPGMAVLRYHKTMRPIPGVSITRNDYSEYLKYRMNEILPDGRKVCAFNPYPRFFDISFVFIGADKTSKMMAKLASRAYVVVPSSYVAESYGYSSSTEQPSTHKEFEKAASVEGARAMLRSFKKRASQRKRAEIIKEIVPSQFGNKAVPILEDSEKDLPKDTLDRMGGCSLSEALSTPTMLGITLKPREFQRITLCRMGRKGLADKLDDDGKVFGPSDDVDRSVPMGSEFISSLIGKMLRGAIEERSALGPPLKRRMIRITIIGKPKSEEPDLEETKDDLLDKVSAAYNGYREQMIEKIADISRQLCRYPELRAAVYGKDEADIFYGLTKESAGVDPSLLLGAIPATYLLSSLARHKMQKKSLRGEQSGLLTRVLAEHPNLAATAAGVAALKAGGSDLPDKVLKGAITVGKRLIGVG